MKKYFDENPVYFDNDGDIEMEIQLDESIFGKACKFNKGKAFRRYWLFGL